VAPLADSEFVEVVACPADVAADVLRCENQWSDTGQAVRAERSLAGQTGRVAGDALESAFHEGFWRTAVCADAGNVQIFSRSAGGAVSLHPCGAVAAAAMAAIAGVCYFGVVETSRTFQRADAVRFEPSAIGTPDALLSVVCAVAKHARYVTLVAIVVDVWR
jgi:hypothetical protein